MTGATLARRREAAGLNRRQLAARLGVSPSMITRWEKAEVKISPESSERLEAALAGKPVETLEARVTRLEGQMELMLEWMQKRSAVDVS